MNRIYLVRHGENYANISKEFSYKSVDYDLTEKGRLQAEQTALYFRQIQVNYLYSSPLKRALQTAEYIAEVINRNIETVEYFRELNVGDLEKSKPDKKSWDIYFKVMDDWFNGKKNSTFPNGENYKTLLERFYAGLEYVTKEKDNENIVVVGHAGIFLAGILELCSIKNKKEFVSRRNNNCSISEITLKKKKNKLTAELIRWADDSHLSGEAAEFIN
ncbi:MAG: histidine phosphatase family protein [Treponema sp.]|nr:histidine phosphatase family protein [Treponema sp.]